MIYGDEMEKGPTTDPKDAAMADERERAFAQYMTGRAPDPEELGYAKRMFLAGWDAALRPVKPEPPVPEPRVEVIWDCRATERRDRFAAAALTGLLAGRTSHAFPEEVAILAWSAADAMLANESSLASSLRNPERTHESAPGAEGHA